MLKAENAAPRYALSLPVPYRFNPPINPMPKVDIRL
jgi:hypothetical protein